MKKRKNQFTPQEIVWSALGSSGIIRRKGISAIRRNCQKNRRISGFKLLELLLFLVVVVGILTIGLRRYWTYEERANLYGISSDEARIMLSLNEYFQNQGCTPNGIFNPSANLAPSLNDLNLSELQNRLPAVRAYHAKIEITDHKIGTKPVYKLIVVAELNPNFDTKKMQAIANLFNAALENNQLIWTNFPSEGLAEAGNEVWVLQASAKEFRRKQNALGLNKDISPSNCVGG